VAVPRIGGWQRRVGGYSSETGRPGCLGVVVNMLTRDESLRIDSVKMCQILG
jgi:hypothetical protein